MLAISIGLFALTTSEKEGVLSSRTLSGIEISSPSTLYDVLHYIQDETSTNTGIYPTATPTATPTTLTSTIVKFSATKDFHNADMTAFVQDLGVKEKAELVSELQTILSGASPAPVNIEITQFSWSNTRVVNKKIYGTLTFTFEYSFIAEHYGVNQEQATEAYTTVVQTLNEGITTMSNDLMAMDAPVFGAVSVALVSVSQPTISFLTTASPTMMPVMLDPYEKNCLSVTMAAMGGHGWGNAKLLVYSTVTADRSLHAPTCRANPTTFSYCFHNQPSMTPTASPTVVPTPKPSPKPTTIKKSATTSSDSVSAADAAPLTTPVGAISTESAKSQDQSAAGVEATATTEATTGTTAKETTGTTATEATATTEADKTSAEKATTATTGQYQQVYSAGAASTMLSDAAAQQSQSRKTASTNGETTYLMSADVPVGRTLSAAANDDATLSPTAKPTSEPTAEPTAKPTAEPTAKPTAEPTAVPTVVPTAEPTAVPTDAPDYIILKVVGLETEDADAVSWRVVTGGVTYVGNYETTLIFTVQPLVISGVDYTSVVLESATGLVIPPESNECAAPEVKYENRMYNGRQLTTPIQMTPIQLSPIQISGPGLVSGPVSPSQQTWAGSGSSADDSTNSTALETGFSLDHFIFDVNGLPDSLYGPKVSFYAEDQSLVASGVLNDDGTLACDIRLSDGAYTMKVTKSLVDDSAVSWRFCHKIGRVGAELHFTVQGEECSPSPVKYVAATCVDTRHRSESSLSSSNASLAEALITVGGVMELHGVGSDELSPGDSKLLRNAISEEFSDANLGASPLPDHATELLPVGALPVKRRLAGDEQRGMTKQVAFKVTMSVPKFEVADLKKYLDHSMTSGLFVTRVRSLGKAAASPRLSSLSKASLLDLHVVHQTLENEKMSMFASAVVGVCGVAGLVLATLLVVRYRRMRQFKYELAPADSEHGVSI